MGAEPVTSEAEDKGPFFRTMLKAAAIVLGISITSETLFLDAFQLRTPSMEPTLVGRIQGGDRVLVSRLFNGCTDSQRFDILLFHHPNNDQLLYMKRLIGLPDDQVFFRGGDIFLSDSDFGGTLEEGIEVGRVTTMRKPDGLQNQLLEAFPIVSEAEWEDWNWDLFRRHFKADRPEVFSEHQKGVLLRTDDVAFARILRPLKDHLADHANNTPGQFVSMGSRPVGDVSITLDLTLLSAGGEFLLEIDDGAQEEVVTARINTQAGQVQLLRAGLALGTAPMEMDPGEKARLRFDNLDDTLSFYLDGDLILRRHYVHPVLPEGSASASQVRIGGRQVDCVFRPVSLLRDIEYIPGQRSRFIVPPDHGFFLGDNTASSFDSRAFERVAITRTGSSEPLIGDAVGSGVGSLNLHGSNPWQHTDGTYHFSDLGGHLHVLADATAFQTKGRWPTPFVHLSRVVGRGVAVAWPMNRWKLLR